MNTLSTVTTRGFKTQSFTALSPRSPEEILAPLDLAPLEELSRNSVSLVSNQEARFTRDGHTYTLPRYLFVGPRGGDIPIRLGFFAGIHGDEPEGTHAIIKLLQVLEEQPELATGYYLSFYPICNPTGFINNTREASNGKDLNREFWRSSKEPEVQLLQADLQSRSFQGLVSLHTDDTSSGFYGYAAGNVITEDILRPILHSVDSIIPINQSPVIDGFHAHQGIVTRLFQGVLSSPPKIRPKPFELILEVPADVGAYLKQLAFLQASLTVLAEYRKLAGYALNI